MQQLPLIGGAYAARSVISNAQRSLNLYPEPNRADSPTKMTHYQRPGLSRLVAPAVAALGRGLYQASNGDGYAVIGNKLVFVDRNWTIHQLGTMNGFVWQNDVSICSMVDNGLQLLVVDGLPYAGNANGYVDFAVNPVAASTVTLNGVVFTFIAGATSGNNIHIGATVALTIDNLLTVLLASTNAALTGAAYVTADDGGGGVYLYVAFKTPGATGALYTLAASVATPSAAHLNFAATFKGGGWRVDLGDATGTTFTRITDASWTGATLVSYIDSFIVWNAPGTDQFWSSSSFTIEPIDATYSAAKTNWPDPLAGVIANQSELVLVGSLKSETWYDAGGATFPFARLPGATTEHGCVAPNSICSADQNVYFLSQDLQGRAVVLRRRGHEVQRISNYAVEYALQQMSTVSDAVGYTYQHDGHLFYVLSFPTGNATWVWDESIGEAELGWHQRGWLDGNGTVNRERGVLGAALYGKNVVIDWENGSILEMSPTVYTDTVGTTDYPVLFLRTFPHLMAGTDPKTGQMVSANGQMVQHDRFAMDVEFGTVSAAELDPQFTLRWSDDRGKTWGQPVLLSAGRAGEYGTRTDGRALGQAMDRVYELSWTFPGQVALNGAWVEGRVLNQ